MKLLTDTEIPVIHADGRVIMIWRFAAGSVLDRSRWYAMMPPLDLLLVPEPEVPKVETFEAVLCLVDGLPGYICSGLDITPDKVARILRNVRTLAKIAPFGSMVCVYCWHMDFEGNVREGGCRPGMELLQPDPSSLQRVAVDVGESRLDLSVEALAAASAWDLLRRQR